MNDISTVVGESTVIKGNLQGDEDLTVYGKLEGGVNLTKTLIVEGSGVVVADIEVRDAIISGVVVGNITASNSVQLTEEGRMVGDIAAPRVIIVDGASFRGHVDMGDLSAPHTEPRPAARVSRPSLPSERTLSRPSAPRRTEATPPRPTPPRPAAPAKPQKPAQSPPKPAKKKTPQKKGRKPPKPPSMPSGKRKVKRRR